MHVCIKCVEYNHCRYKCDLHTTHMCAQILSRFFIDLRHFVELLSQFDSIFSVLHIFGAVCSSPDGDEGVSVVMATCYTGYTFGAYRRCNWISCEYVCHKFYVIGNSNNTPLAPPPPRAYPLQQHSNVDLTLQNNNKDYKIPRWSIRFYVAISGLNSVEFNKMLFYGWILT